jgi:dihydrofolate reductase
MKRPMTLRRKPDIPRLKYYKAIAAMSENRVIGQGGKIPWHLSEDFKFFKKTTTGQVVVMGRKTFESIGKPLSNRTTIVLSRGSFAYPGALTAADLGKIDWTDAALAGREVFICGGAEIYAQTLTSCSDLYLTLVKKKVEGDAFFPPFEHLFQPPEVVMDRPEFKILHYRRITGGG